MPRICCICESTKKTVCVDDKVYCGKHYTQIKRHGYIKDRTIFDKNDFIIYDDYIEIIIYNNKNEPVNKTIIDKEDLELIKDYKLHSDGHGYVKWAKYINNKKHVGLLHRLILNITDENIIIDHINRNRSDNRKQNLRIVNECDNRKNHNMYSNNTSGFNGIWWNKRNNNWCVEIRYDKTKVHLGSFTSIDNAIIARELGELKFFKEFSPQHEYLSEKYKNVDIELTTIKDIRRLNIIYKSK